MKRLFELIAPHKGTVLIASLCSLVVSIINGAFAWFVKTIVDDIFVMGDKMVLFYVAIGVVTAFVVRGLFVFFQNYLMFSVGAKVVRDIRNGLYRRIVYLPMGYFGTDSRGSILSKAISDAGILQELLAFRIKDFFVCTGTVFILTGVAMSRRFDLTILALGVLPFAYFIVGKIGKRLKKVSRWTQMKLAHITDSLTEGITGIKIIKSFCVEELESEKFSQKTDGYFTHFMKSVKMIQLTSLLMEVVAGIGVAAIIYYGGQLIAEGEMTAGDFFSFMAAILMIFTPAKRLAAVSNGLQQARAYVERIDDVLMRETEKQGERTLAEFKKAITYDSVRFRYPTRDDYALEGISVDIKKGDVVAIVGRSGSGKTTFVDLLSRFFNLDDGRILIDGVDIREFTNHALRSLIGIVSQDVILFNDTVRANIAFGKPGATDEEIRSAAMTAFANEFILDFPDGYDAMIGEEGANLSGGQRQRLSIARAIIKDPEILVLDEATSSLDTQSELMVQKAMDSLMDHGSSGDTNKRKTIIVIAHRLSTIKRAQKIIVLDRGRLIESGSHDELVGSGGMYSHLYSLQHGGQIDVSSL